MTISADRDIKDVRLPEGAKHGYRKVPGDDAKPEKEDRSKRIRARLPSAGEDASALATFLFVMVLIVITFGTVGFAVRLFLFASGMREGLF